MRPRHARAARTRGDTVRPTSRLRSLAFLAALAGLGVLLRRFVGPPSVPDLPPWPAGNPLTTWLGAARDWWALHADQPSFAIDGSAALPWIIRVLWLLWAVLAISAARDLAMSLPARHMVRRAPRHRAVRPGRALGGAAGWLAGLRLLQIGGTAVGAAAPEPPVTHTQALDLPIGPSTIPSHAVDHHAATVVVDGAIPRSATAGGGTVATGGAPATIPSVAAEGTEHIVEPGDTLWGLAERYYGDGHLYGRIIEANAGRSMPDGRPFDGQLRPGDRLVIPGLEGVTPAPTGVAPGYVEHVVERGETLRAIAREATGDEGDWHRIRTIDGRPATALPNPDLIYPGDRFLVPIAPSADPEPAPLAPLVVEQLVGVTPAGETVVLAAPVASDGTPLTVVAVGAAAHGRVALTADGRIAYTASADHRGGDSFGFIAADGTGRQASGTAQISVVAPATRAPQPTPVIAGAGFGTGARAVALVPVSMSAPPPTAPASPTPTIAAPPPPTRMPTPTVPAPVPSAAASTEPTARPVGGTPFTGAAVGLVAVGATATLALAARRWSRRGWRFAPPATAGSAEDAASVAPVIAPLAEVATEAEAFAYRTIGGEVEPITRLVAVLDRALAADGYAARVVCAAYEQGRASALVAADPAEREALLDGAPALGVRLGCRATAELPGGTRGLVELRLSRLRVAAFYGQEVPRDLPVLRLAVLPSGATLALSWASPAVGHLLVAGSDPGCVQEVLTTALAELVGRRTPADLAIWGVGDGPLLRDAFADVPHLADTPLASRDRDGLVALLSGLTAELALREAEGDGERPELLLVIEDLAALAASDEAILIPLERLGRDGARRGIRLLAGLTAAHEAGLLLDHFRSRLVLRVDEASSTLLLGSPLAAELAADGGIVARWGDAPPQPLADYPPDATRAVRVEPDELRDLIAAINRHYAPPAAPPDPTHGPNDDTRATLGDEGEAAEEAAVDGAPSIAGETTPEPVVERVLAGPATPASAEAVIDVGIMLDTTSDAQQEEPESSDGLGEDAIEAAFARRFAAARAAAGGAAAGRVGGAEPGPIGEPAPIPGAPDRAGAPLRIRALGPVMFVPDYGLAERFAAQAKPLQLLLALACTQPGSLGWEQLCGMVWPEEDLSPAQARNRFHRLMNELRGILASAVPGIPREAIRAANGTYALDPEYIQSDVHEFLLALDRVRDADGDLDAAIAALGVARDRWTGALCTGQVAEWLTPSDEARLADRYAQQLAETTRRLASRAARLRRWPEARLLYGLLMEDDPCRVQWVRELMTACAELGDERGVVAVEAAHAEALRESYGVDAGDNPIDLAVSPEVREHRERMLARSRSVREAFVDSATAVPAGADQTLGALAT